MKSKRPAFSLKTLSSFVATKSSAPSLSASSRLFGEWLSTVTSAPMRVGDLHRHVAEAAQAHHGDLVAGLHAEMLAAASRW